MRRSRPPVLAVVLACAAGIAGCASLQSSDNLLGVITPYRVEVVQGNVLTREQIAKVAPGMTRTQVRDVLGSPLLTDIFHTDRWDYVFTIRRQGAEPQRRSVVVRFDGDVMKSIDGAAELPSEREFVASISTAKPGTVPKLEMTEAERSGLPVPPRAAAEPTAVAPSGPLRRYPPLETR